MGNLIWIIIVFAVISLISSAVKKSQQKAKDQNKEGQQPRAPRPPVMSDIQKAFNMMNDFNGKESQKEDRPYVHSEGAAYHHEGVTSHEGTHGHGDGATSREGFHGHTDGRPSHEGTHGHGDGRFSTEGMHDHEGVRVHNAPITTMKDGYSSALSETYNKRVSSGQNKYAKALGEFSNQFEQDTDAVILTPTKKRKGGMTLFDNKNEFVRAVVYSEILSRKTARR